MDPDEEDVQEVHVWRGMTGCRLTTTRCKPSTTVLQVKQEILAKTGFPIEQQRLCGFGGGDVLGDEALVCSVEGLAGCGGLQIIIDQPQDKPKVWEESTDEESVDEECLEAEKLKSASSLPGGRRRGRRPQAAVVAGGSRQAGARPPSPRCAGGRAGRRRTPPKDGAKQQHHFVLAAELQDCAFDVLQRAKARTKAIWQETGVCVRLHGPGIQGAGHREDEHALMLSLSAKGGDTRPDKFREAVQLSEDLIRSLYEQYRSFCVKRRLPPPTLVEPERQRGYRRGSHKAGRGPAG